MVPDYPVGPGIDGTWHGEMRGCDGAYPSRTKRDVGFVLGLGVLRHTRTIQYSLEFRRTRGQRDLLNPSALRYFREPTNDVSALIFGAAYRIR